MGTRDSLDWELGKIYSPVETEPVRARLLDPEVRKKVAAQWVADCVLEGYGSGESVEEIASDLVEFGIATYDLLTEIAEGTPWNGAISPPSTFVDILERIDQKEVAHHG